MDEKPAPPDSSPWSPRLNGTVFGGDVVDEAAGRDDEDRAVPCNPKQPLGGRADIDTAMLQALQREMVGDSGLPLPGLGGRSDIDSAMLRALRLAKDVYSQSRDA